MGKRKKAHSSAPVTAGQEALDGLVRQFSQPLAFLRELIQNSLDASTNRVDVEVAFDAEEGCARVEVADSGEGMNREVIDTQLTRLFASSKEGDLTRIGKFGIGFVSVFATRPRAVVVDTGRDGEYWRVLFRPDRSFERIRRNEPVEGTRVSSWISVEKKNFDRFVADCRDTVVFWCKHCDVEIRFNKKPINQPFELGLPGEVRYLVPGSEVVAAPSLDPNPFYGFYNRGLTLLEGAGSPLPGVSFKLRSHYLEHTLTRDNVVRDKNYDKAMRIVATAAYERLPLQLFEQLAAAAPHSPLWELAAVAAGYPQPLPPQALARPIFASHGQAPLSPAELLRSKQGVAWSAEPTPLVEALVEAGIPVLRTDPDSSALRLLERLGIAAVPAEQGWFLVREASLDEGQARLFEVASRLLQEKSLRGGDFSATPGLKGRVAVLCNQPGRPERVGSPGRLTLLNLSHPLLVNLAGLTPRDPSLAAYLLARAVRLSRGGEQKDPDARVLAAAARMRRSGR